MIAVSYQRNTFQSSPCTCSNPGGDPITDKSGHPAEGQRYEVRRGLRVDEASYRLSPGNTG